MSNLQPQMKRYKPFLTVALVACGIAVLAFGGKLFADHNRLIRICFQIDPEKPMIGSNVVCATAKQKDIDYKPGWAHKLIIKERVGDEVHETYFDSAHTRWEMEICNPGLSAEECWAEPYKGQPHE